MLFRSIQLPKLTAQYNKHTGQYNATQIPYAQKPKLVLVLIYILLVKKGKKSTCTIQQLKAHMKNLQQRERLNEVEEK